VLSRFALTGIALRGRLPDQQRDVMMKKHKSSWRCLSLQSVRCEQPSATQTNKRRQLPAPSCSSTGASTTRERFTSEEQDETGGWWDVERVTLLLRL